MHLHTLYILLHYLYTMNITFDDQTTIPAGIAKKKDKGFSLEKVFLSYGIAKNQKQAALYTLIASIGIICICGFITVGSLQKEPIDEKYYYDPATDF